MTDFWRVILCAGKDRFGLLSPNLLSFSSYLFALWRYGLPEVLPVLPGLPDSLPALPEFLPALPGVQPAELPAEVPGEFLPAEVPGEFLPALPALPGVQLAELPAELLHFQVVQPAELPAELPEFLPVLPELPEFLHSLPVVQTAVGGNLLPFLVLIRSVSCA